MQNEIVRLKKENEINKWKNNNLKQDIEKLDQEYINYRNKVIDHANDVRNVAQS